MDVILDMLSRTIEELVARADGPLNFRLVVMPIMVTILAVRAHLKDVKEGKPIFLGAFVASPTERRRLFRSGLGDLGRVFIIACVLDTAYQLLVLREFHPGQMVIVAVVCAIVPYLLVRGPILRVAHFLRHRWGGVADTPTEAPKPNLEDPVKQDSADE
jgi:hypothetical protein